MKHPMEYETKRLFGMHVMIVDAGTTISDERSGCEVTVDDNVSAKKGDVIFCTRKAFDRLKVRVN